MSENVYRTLQRYGVSYSGDQSIPDHTAIAARPNYTLRELVDAGGRVTRVRIFAEYVMGQRWMDLSSAHGTLPNGDVVLIAHLPHIWGPARQMKGSLISWARDEGVFAKGCGLLDEGSWSVLG